MLIRSVRMTFESEKVEDFLRIFDQSKSKIRNVPGCTHLELHRDYTRKNIFATYSIWDSEEALNNYRDSDLFKEVWSKTKALFEKEPVAFSSRLVEEVSERA